MKNYEITNANYALGQLLDEPLKGRFKFKVFNIKSELEKKAEIVTHALEGVEDNEEREEILNESQEVSFEKLMDFELEDIDLTMRQIAMLKPILDMENNKEEE